MKFILTALTGLALVFSADAQIFKAKDFLGGNLGVQITNNTTASYGASLIPMTNYAGSAVYSMTNLYSTNGIISPGTIQTNNNVTYGQAWVDVPVNADRNGVPLAQSIAISLTGVTASTTGAVAFTFVQTLAESSPGVPSVPATETQNKFVVAVTPNATTTVSIITNIPSAQLQGGSGWRLSSVVTPNFAAAGSVILQKVTLNEWVP